MKEYDICDKVKLKRKKLTYGLIQSISHLKGKTTYEILLGNGVWLKYVKPAQIIGGVK
jgi:hypothetical protein